MRNLTRVAVVVLVGLPALLVLGPPAGGAAEAQPVGRRGAAICGPAGCDSSATNAATETRAVRRVASPWTCTYAPLDQGPEVIVYDEDGTPIPVDGTGRWFAKECVAGGARTAKMIYVRPRQPTEIRDEALGHLDLPAPEIRMNPRPDGEQVVNVRTFLWTDESLWQPQESTVSVPGVAVTVRAVPDRLEWDMGTGASEVVRCSGPGRPWNPTVAENRQDTSCSFVYRHPSATQPGLRYPVKATLHWRVSWSVTGAPGGGSLGTLARSSSTSVRVIEIQTVNY